MDTANISWMPDLHELLQDQHYLSQTLQPWTVKSIHTMNNDALLTFLVILLDLNSQIGNKNTYRATLFHWNSS